MKRANIGCGSIQPAGWVNLDTGPAEDINQGLIKGWDVRRPLVQSCYDDEPFDYAVCSFMLQELNFHELPGALDNIRQILKPRGVLRILVPDIIKPFVALVAEDEDWFPQDSRSGGLDGKFCSYVTWFGTVRSVFTANYLMEVCYQAGFEYVRRCEFEETESFWSEITHLDSRPKEALIVEAVK